MKKLIIGAIAAFLFTALIYQPTLVEVIKLRTFDALVQTEEPTGNVVLLNLTEDDIRNEGGWPFPRKRLAKIHIDLPSLVNQIGLGETLILQKPYPTTQVS